MADIKKVISDLRATAPESKLANVKPRQLFVFMQNKTFDPSPVTGQQDPVLEIYEADVKKGNDRTVVRADGLKFLANAETPVFILSRTDSIEVTSSLVAFKERCENIDNIKKLPELKKLFDALGVGYKVEIDPEDWSAVLLVNEDTWNCDAPLFYSLEGTYSLTTEAWSLDRAISLLRTAKEEKEKAAAHAAAISEKWRNLPEDVKYVITEAKKLGLS